METDKPKTKKHAPISYRPPVDKREEVLELHALSGLSFSAFVTDAILSRYRRSRAILKMLAELLACCASISDQLREIEISGTGHAQLILEQIRDELRMIRTALMRLMGRRS